MTKTIGVTDKTWQELTMLKAHLLAKDLDSVITYLLVLNGGNKE